MKNIRILTSMALLLALQLVLTRFASITIPDIVRIGFSFLPLALSAMLFGPLLAGTQGVVEDFLGMALFPQGPYFPGFTLSAFLKGAVFGLLLYNKPKSWLRILLAVLINTVFIDLGLNTLWISILYHKAASAIITVRLLNSALMVPIQAVMIYATWRILGAKLEKNYFLKRV